MYAVCFVFINACVQPNNSRTQKRKCVFKHICLFQGEKECLNSETTELKQKIRYLQDQLLPLSKQREYQEKEIQRLNRVSVEHLWNRKKQNNDPRKVVMLDFSHIRLWKKP